MSVPLPEVVGPYRVLRPLARGGMAEVYEVEERVSGEHMALKVLYQKGGALPRFNREYEAMIRLNHPNIVRVYNYGVWQEFPWLSMELIDGTPIQAYAKRCGRAGTEARTVEVIRVAHDLALALHHIHARGLVHRDLKSANVLVLPDGRVKLLDFGTARVLDPVQAITREGEFIGTFAYAPPEQLLNRGVDHRSDLYSFGVLLYRLSTGKRPFNAKELHALARQHIKEIPKPPGALCALPPGLEEIILALLEKDPANRPASGAEVAHALESVAGRPLYLPGTLDVDLSSERLVGREEQVSALWRFLDGGAQAKGEQPGDQPADMAIVVGLPGAGRSRVMWAMEREISRRKLRYLNLFFLRGSEDLDQIVQALVELSRTVGPDASIEAIEARIALQELARGSGQSVAERLQVVRDAGAGLLHERAKMDGQPVLLLVRGLQHAGPVGFEALVSLREELRALGAAVLFIADCTEEADDPQSMAQKRLPDALRINMPPLTVRQVALLVGSLLNRRPPPALVARRIYNASGGLSTYVEDVVKGLVAGGILRVRSHDTNRIEWAQRDDAEMDVPARAKERVILQLAGMAADRRRVLEALALAGREGSVKVLAGALQCRPVELIPALEDLARRGWISLTKRHRAPYVRWRQILAEQVVLDQLHPCRRRVLERLLIDQVANEPAFVAQIRLLVQVGRMREALERARDWAVYHLAKDQPVTALEVLDFVVPHLEDSDDVDHGIRAQLYLLQSAALLMARPTDPSTGRSLIRAAKLGAPGELFEAEILLTKARTQRVIGHYPNFRKHLMEAWYLVEHGGPTPIGSTIATMLGWSNRAQGHVDDAATWHGRSRRIAVQVGQPVVRAHADVGVAGWQFARGLLLEAERTSVSAISIFDELNDRRGLSEAIPIWVDALRAQGRWSEALRVLYQQLPPTREGEVPTFYVRLLLANAWCETDLGRLGRAQEAVDELGATLRRGEHLHLRLQADLVWGRILAASDLHEDALRRLRAVRERAQSAGLAVIGHAAGATEAEAAWALGDRLGATKLFTSAIRGLRTTGDVPALVDACVAQARAMSGSVDPDRIFRPVEEWAEGKPCHVFRVERHIARGRYAQSRGEGFQVHFQLAQEAIDQLVLGLNATDAAALRLSPWTRWIRRAGESSAEDA